MAVMRMAGTCERVELFSALPTGAQPRPVDSNWLHYPSLALWPSSGAAPKDCRQSCAVSLSFVRAPRRYPMAIAAATVSTVSISAYAQPK